MNDTTTQQQAMSHLTLPLFVYFACQIAQRMKNRCCTIEAIEVYVYNRQQTFCVTYKTKCDRGLFSKNLTRICILKLIRSVVKKKLLLNKSKIRCAAFEKSRQLSLKIFPEMLLAKYERGNGLTAPCSSSSKLASIYVSFYLIL